MDTFDPQSYGPVFAPLVGFERRRALDTGTPNTSARAALERLEIKPAFAHVTRSIADRDMAACSLSAVWLLHDYLDESHTISQGIKTASGSFWHAIMHRREGDFSNAKYWFRHVGRHPVFDALGTRAAEWAARSESGTLDSLAPGGEWNPFAFVDLCEAARRGRGDLPERCLDLQQAEWELLFDHCYCAAVGRVGRSLYDRRTAVGHGVRPC
jgi:hypothetical protein